MSRPPTLSFIIPVRNDAQRLARCLRSIKANGYPADCLEIIVADNGSSDGSDLTAEAAGARVLRLPGRPVAALRNEAAAQASGELLAFVDADHELDPRWTAAAVAALAEDGVGGAGAPYHSPANGTWVQRAYDGLRRRAPGRCETDWLGSGNLVIRRSVFVALHGFDTRLETCEDVDLCQRLRARGYRLISDPGLKSIHHGDPSSIAALFRGELWRGRDNLSVSLRGALSLRDLPSVAIPVVDLLLLFGAAIGCATLSRTGVILAVTALAAVAALASVRTVVMASRLRAGRAFGMQLFVVALTYDAARALALVARGSHAGRRR